MLLFQALAVLSTSIYFAGLVSLKAAAVSMPELAVNRPLELARAMLGDRIWIGGAATLVVGACAQAAALTRLSPVQAQPLFLAGIPVLLGLTVQVMGERLSRREWACVLLLAIATALFTDASGILADHIAAEAAALVPAGPAPAAGTSTVAPAHLVVAVALPSLLVPVIVFLASERSRDGLHARPVTGIALAINVGVLTGTAELMLMGAARHAEHPYTLITTPYPYLFAVTAPLALGQLQIALQRSRLSITGLVATATAKTYLLLAATVVYREPWPDGRTGQVAAALALSVLAIAGVPHHEPTGVRPREPPAFRAANLPARATRAGRRDHTAEHDHRPLHPAGPANRRPGPANRRHAQTA